MYYIRDHAIRKYKRIVGRRTATKKRLIAQINRDLELDVKEKRPSKVKNHYILVTSKYQAVIYRREVVTLLYLGNSAHHSEYMRKRRELLLDV